VTLGNRGLSTSDAEVLMKAKHCRNNLEEGIMERKFGITYPKTSLPIDEITLNKVNGYYTKSNFWDKSGRSKCKSGKEIYEKFLNPFTKKEECFYEYRTENGVLFSWLDESLEKCRKEKDEWLSLRKKKKNIQELLMENDKLTEKLITLSALCIVANKIKKVCTGK